MADETIDIKVNVDANTGKMQVFSDAMKKTGQAAKKTESSFLGLKGAAGELARAYVGLISGREIVRFFTDSVKAADEENEVLRRLKFNVEAVGESFDKAAAGIEKWSAQIQATTRFTDTQALTSLDRFVRVTNDLGSARLAVNLTMGLAVASGKEMVTVEGLLADLLQGNTRSLITLNREFGGFLDGAVTAQQVLDVLVDKFGQAAQEERGFTKEVKQLSAEFGDFKEQVGRGLIPTISAIIPVLKRVFTWLNQIGSGLASMAAIGVTAFNTLSVAGAQAVTGRFRSALSTITTFKFQVRSILDETNRQFVEAQRRADQAVVESESARQKLRAKEVPGTDKLEEVLAKQDAQIKQAISAQDKFINDRIARLTRMSDETIREYKKIQANTENFAQNLSNVIAKKMVQDVSKAFSDMIVSGTSFEKSFVNIFQSINGMIIQAITQMIIFRSIATALGGPFGGFTAFGAAPGGGPGARGGGVPGFGSSGIILPGQAGFGGGGGGANVNVSVSANTLDLSNADFLLRKLAEEIATKSQSSVMFSRRVNETNTANSRLSV